ncbi:hypothetical protein HY480_00360 [Candidatus Uhrbacteria bacterium]|nr:hypothetical protein [Candidatus Uhrbacteria bacterium]
MSTIVHARMRIVRCIVKTEPRDNKTPQRVAEESQHIRILARTIYRELKTNGATPRQLVTFAVELFSRARQEPEESPRT